MAKIRIKGDTSGYIDLAAPAEAGTQTLTLPTSGSLLTSASDSSDFPDGAITTSKIASGVITPTAVSDQNNTSTGYFDLPSGTSAQRPDSPTEGFIRYNTDQDWVEVYQNDSWRTFNSSPAGEYSQLNLFYDFDPADLEYSNGATLSSGTVLNTRSPNLTTTVRGTNLLYNTADGGHLDTNGKNGYLNTADTASFSALSAATSISVVIWFQSNGADRQVLVARYGTGYPNQFNHIVDPTGDFHHNSTGVISGASGDLDNATNWWEDDTWTHSVWVYNVSDGIARWYINGSEVVTVNYGTDSGNGLSTSSTANFSIASRSDDLERLNGKIGPVRLYTRALTAQEISDDWTATRARFGV